MPQPCPKCASLTWYEVEPKEVALRCLCGYHEVVYSELENGGFIRHTQPEEDTILPRRGTKMASCLSALASLPEGRGATKEVATLSGFTSSDAATYLMVLQHRGLVEKTKENKGRAGGSLWRLTERAERRMR